MGGLPEWSPSGATIAYVSRRALYRVRVRGGSPRRLVRRRAGGASFSPNGRALAFQQVRDSLEMSLFTARSSDGGRARRIAKGGELPVGSTYVRWGAPSWQPRP